MLVKVCASIQIAVMNYLKNLKSRFKIRGPLEIECNLSEDRCKENPNDAEELTRWAVALLYLTRNQSLPTSLHTIELAFPKLEKAFSLNPNNPDILWITGMTFSYKASLLIKQDEDEVLNLDLAEFYYKKAAEYFQRAYNQDPHNQAYKSSHEVSTKLHVERIEYFRRQSSKKSQGSSSSSQGSSSSATIMAPDAKIHTRGLLKLKQQ